MRWPSRRSTRCPACSGAWVWYRGECADARPGARVLGAAARRAGLGARRSRWPSARSPRPGKSASEGLFYLYALLPLAVAFVAEQLRVASAQTILDQRGLPDAAAVGRLPEAEQQRARRARSFSREIGVMALSALVVVVACALSRRRARPTGSGVGPIYSPPHEGRRQHRWSCSPAPSRWARADRRKSRSPRRSPYYQRRGRSSATTAPAATRCGASAREGSATSIGNRRQDERAELQHPQGERRTGPLRDPQRRLLRRDHAREHRRRRRSAGGRGIPGARTPGVRRRHVPSTNITLSDQIGRTAERVRRA